MLFACPISTVMTLATSALTIIRPFCERTRLNSQPVAVDDVATVAAGTPVTLNLLANDNDPDGDPLALAGMSMPQHGRLATNPDQSVVYTPDAGFSGEDGFSYTISDGRGGTAVGEVHVTVQPPPALPTFANGYAWRRRLVVPPHGLDRRMVVVPGGDFLVGSDDRRLSYDNERPAHEIELPPFAIDTTPVSNADYIAFMDAGGYARREWWSDVGWTWLQESGVTSPKHWYREGDAWRTREMDRQTDLDPNRPVVHVCYHEAEAFARFAGKRLPTETEWEVAAGWNPEARRNLRRRVFRHGDDGVGAVGVAARQRRVVAADLGLCPGAVVEEVEVVDRDDLRRAPGRHQQRVHGVGDVDRPGEPLDRRQFQPVPREIQHRHRNSRVDDRQPRDRVRGQPVLPGARKEGQRVVKGQRPGERAGQLVRVFADACAFA